MTDTSKRGPRATRRSLLMLGAAGALGGAGAAMMGEDASAQAPAAAPSAAPYDWKTMPYGGGGFIDGFLYHPKEKGLLYCRTDVGGAYRFDGAKKRWIPLQDHLGPDEADLMGVLAMAVDPNNPDRLYLACGEYLPDWAQDGAVLRSEDRGATWAKTTLFKGFKLGGNADGRGCGERLMVDPNLGDILFLGTNQHGLYKSIDAGKSFTKVDGYPSKNCTLVLIDGRGGQAGRPSSTVYVGCGEGEGGLYKSTDGGATFALVPGLPGKQFPQRAVMDAKGALYVTLSDGLAPAGGKTGGLYRMDGASGRWKEISPMRPGVGGAPGFAYCGVDVDPNRPGTVIVSTMNRWAIHDDVYISRDDGAHWKAMGERSVHNPKGYPWLINYMKGQDRMGHWIADVKIDPFNSDSMIYGTGYGLWMTLNLGQMDGKEKVQFDFVQENLEETCATDMASPKAGATVYVAMGDVGGTGYDFLDRSPKEGLFAPAGGSNRSVDFAELAPKYVVRTADGGPTSGFYSEDAGLSWKPFATSPHVKRNAKGGWQNSGRICISARGTALLWTPEKQGAFYSRDMGKTWTASTGLPPFEDTYFPAASDRAVDGVFYLHDRVNSTILMSIDSGATFTPVIKGLPKLAGWQGSRLVAVAGQVRDLWLMTPLGLFHTPNDKTPMTQVKSVETANLFSAGAPAPGKAYQAVYITGKIKGRNGLWRSDDVGATWARINDDRTQFGSLRAMAADPTEYGTLYIGPHGRGVLVGRPRRA